MRKWTQKLVWKSNIVRLFGRLKDKERLFGKYVKRTLASITSSHCEVKSVSSTAPDAPDELPE